MAKKLILVIIFGFFLLLVIAEAAQWIPLREDNESNTYVDVESIEYYGNFAKVWVKRIPKPNAKTPFTAEWFDEKESKGYGDIESIEYSGDYGKTWTRKSPNPATYEWFEELDCKEKKSNLLRYKTQELLVTYKPKWTPFDPEGNVGYLFKYICKEIVTQKEPVSIPADVKEAKQIAPSLPIDKSVKVIAPSVSTDNGEAVQKESIPIPVDDKEVTQVSPPAIDELKKPTTPPLKIVKKPAPVKKEVLKKTIYAVHVGVFFHEGKAVSFSDKWKKKDYAAYVRKVLRADNKTIYRVLIGKYSKKNHALKQSSIIREQEGIRSFVYYYDRDS